LKDFSKNASIESKKFNYQELCFLHVSLEFMNIPMEIEFRLKSLSSLTSIEFASSSVPLANHIKLLGVTLDNHLNFDH